MKKWFSWMVIVWLLYPMSGWHVFATSSITWTAQEQAYIDAHPVLTLAVDPQFVPFEFIENGTYKGIASDYVALLEERIGFDLQVVPDLTWTQAYYQALDGDIDILPAVSKTANREQFFAFSDMYYEIRRVIVTRNTNTAVRTMSDLFGRTIAVQTNSSHHSFLEAYPEINISQYATVGDALTAVSEGSEYAFVGNLATSDYLIKSNGLTNLRFVTVPSDTKIGLHFAVLKDNTVLLSILNKALATITTQERVDINSRWVTIDTDTDYGPLIQTIIGVIVLFALAGGISMFWIVRLKREVDQRKKTQVELEQAKRIAEEANLVKSTFMARMSHEIRTPLNAITGMSYLLKKTNVSLTQRLYADRITQASQTMLSLINDILDYSKIEANKIELETITFSIDQIIHNLMSIMAVKMEDKGLNFRFIKDSSIPVWFFGDPKRLEQIIMNLLNNAIKFTDKGEIAFEIHETAREDALHHLTFTIKDTGIGMSKQTLDQLFTPFTQADSSINRRFGGSGLGLSIVKYLVELMGGTVKVFSTEGKGSTFIVSLSLTADTAKEASERDESSADFLKTVRTLVCDKSTSSLTMVETYLHSYGMPCELTTSSTAAESILELANGEMKNPFDLVIMDYDTPPEKGLEFVARLKAHPKLRRIPKVIMLLPMQRTDLFDQLGQHHIDSGVGKPVISSILHNSIIELFVHQVMSATEGLTSPTMQPMAKINKCVLVVDDNNTNQLIAKLLLEQSGFDVMTANDGADAVRMYEQHSTSIHLILMDIHMPVMNGYDAAKAIKSMNPNTIIVAMTAEVTTGVKEKCKEAGMPHYISKPFDPEHFVDTIRSIMSTEGHQVQYQPTALNVKKGIRQMGDNADLYGLVVQEFYRENLRTSESIRTAILNRNFTEARQHLHKIKGSAGGIGAEGLLTAINHLQQAIVGQNESQINTELQQVMTELASVLNYIRITYVTPSKEATE